MKTLAPTALDAVGASKTSGWPLGNRGNGGGRKRSGPRILPLTQVAIDGATRQAVQHDAAQELGVGLLDLFRLRRDLARQANGELNCDGLPHGMLPSRGSWFQEQYYIIFPKSKALQIA